MPDAGETVRAVENDRKARQLADERGDRLKTEALARRQAATVSLEDVFERVREGKTAELNLILKADVAGSLEAIQDEIAKLPQDQVTVNVIHTATGGISNSDVMLAAASGAVIIGFNVRPLPEAAIARRRTKASTFAPTRSSTRSPRTCARRCSACSSPRRSSSRSAWPRCARRSAPRGSARSPAATSRRARSLGPRRSALVRDGTIVFEGTIASLKRFKDDVREVEEGFECGIVLEGFQDVKDGDVIEAYETRRSSGSSPDQDRPWPQKRSRTLRWLTSSPDDPSSLPENGSLKGKRKELLAVKAALGGASAPR